MTKNRIINDMIGIVRNRAYIERDNGAIDEAAAYERKRNGATGAINGHHDDRVITRAMALSLAKELHLKHLRALAHPLHCIGGICGSAGPGLCKDLQTT